MIELGEKVKDSITGFKGIAVAKCEYLYGCMQFQVEGIDKDNAPKSWWFDFQRLELIKKRKVVKRESGTYRRGGAQAVPSGRSHPSSMTSDSE